jgi:GNAT superfamily N-acetyltransferase
VVTSTASGWSVRRATASDAHAIATVHVAAWRETYAHLLPATQLAALDVQRRSEVWADILAEGITEVWVAESQVGDTAGVTVMGWASASTGRGAGAPRARELEGLYVLAGRHGSGAGQALLDAALGSSPAFLWVAADNPRPHAFYRRNGFTPDGTKELYPLLGVDVEVVRLVR